MARRKRHGDLQDWLTRGVARGPRADMPDIHGGIEEGIRPVVAEPLEGFGCSQPWAGVLDGDGSVTGSECRDGIRPRASEGFRPDHERNPQLRRAGDRRPGHVRLL